MEKQILNILKNPTYYCKWFNLPREKRSGWIYVVQSSTTNLYKIGKASTPARWRQFTCKGRGSLIALIPTLNRTKTETFFHLLLADYKVHSEWFELPIGIIQFLLTINSFESFISPYLPPKPAIALIKTTQIIQERYKRNNIAICICGGRNVVNI